jgi:hypothetical protein
MATLYPILESVMDPTSVDASSTHNLVDASSTHNLVDASSTHNLVDASSTHNLVDTSSTHNLVDTSSTHNLVDTNSTQLVIRLNLPPPPPVKLNSNPTLTDIFNVIITNPVFTREIEVFIKSLQVTGGKLTTANIPILLLLLTDLIDNTGNFNLSTASLPVLIKMIYEYLVNRYDLIPLTDRAVCEEMFLCSMNLLLRVPVKKIKNRLVKLFSCCK